MDTQYDLRGYKFKLFLQGVEIPFKNLNVSFTNNSTFTINIPPFIEATELEPNTYGLVVFKNRKIDTKWKALCEGIYNGPGFTKTANSRTSTLTFKDVKWFFENSKLFDIFATEKSFAPAEAIFLGDVRYEDGSQKEVNEEEAQEILSSAGFKARADFLNRFSSDSETPVTDSLNWLLDNMIKNNEFSKKHAEKLKLASNRFKIIENKNTKSVFQQTVINDIYDSIFENANPLTSINDLIYSLGQVLQYDITPIPGFASSDMETYAFKPKMELVTPPACNVIFPDEFTSLNFRKSFSDIPTRYRLVDSLLGDNSFGFYAPKEIEEMFKEIKEGNEDITDYLTDEEKFKGVIPYQSSLPFSQTLSLGFDKNKLNNHLKFKSLYTNYTYYENKYKSVPLNLEVAFKPGLLPGFPVLVLDKEVPLIGYLQGVTHNVNLSQGYGFSTLTISHVRPVSKRVPILAGWYSKEQFAPENITDSIYSEFNTKDAFFKGEKPEIDDDMIDYYNATKDLINSYKNAPDRLEFQKSFQRELPTFYDESGNESDTIINTLGLDWNRNKEELTGNNLTNIGLEVNHKIRTEDGFETSSKDVGQARKDMAKRLKQRMNSSDVARRRFSKEEDE